jgi:RimJ/RimL family protein N-acetyltransferase
MLETERLVMKLMDEQDAEEIVAWRSRKDIIDSLFSAAGITLAQHRNWYAGYVKNDTRMEFVINTKADQKKIGTIGLSGIDYKNQKAEYGILIGEKQERGKGYAQEASRAIMAYGFFDLNLQKIKLNVFADNIQAVSLYKKLGFKEEGILRREIYKNGCFKDVMVMAVLREEWVNHA